MRTTGLALAVSFVGAACGGGGDVYPPDPDAEVPTDICTADALAAALQAATPGSTVTIGACSIEGEFRGQLEPHFEVPNGVTLAGVSVDDSEIVGTAGAAVYLVAGPGESTVRDLTVRSSGQYGIAAAGNGWSVVIERVRVIATGGDAAVDLEEIDGATIRELELRGSVVAADQGELLFMPDPDRFPTLGLRLDGIDNAVLSDITGGGFESAVVSIRATPTTLTRASLSATATTGLLVVNSNDVILTDVEISELWKGYLPSAAAMFRGSMVTSLRLDVSGSEQYGIVQESGGSGDHTDVTVTGSADVGVKIDGVDGVAITGATLTANHGAGILLLRSRNVTIDGAVASGTLAMLVNLGGNTTAMVGDGIEVIRPQGPIAILDSTLSNNERLGLLIEVGSTTAGVTLTAVTVNGTGAQLGAIAQDLTSVIPSGTDGWDTSVTRQGDTTANDAAVTTRLGSFQ